MDRDTGASDVCLESRGLSIEFGGLKALDSVNISIRDGEIVGLIGPNGSGKSTWMNCVSGIYRPSGGRVLLRGKDVTRAQCHRLSKAGLGRTFQRLENFPAMSVRDNLLVSAQEHRGTLGSRLFRFTEHSEVQRAEEILDFMGLAHLGGELIRTLSYGQQKLCDLAMALMPDPRLILLDEPMAGVNPALVQDLSQRIRELNRQGKTFVIVEHNMNVIMELCDRLIVLDHSVKIADGEPAEIQRNPQVMEAYFGADD